MLELKNLSFNVQDESKEKEIIRHMDLKIDDGKFVVVTGPNGGGKSTMAKLIAGIEKPTEGRIFFNGEDITDLGITERAKLGISFAFQQPAKFKGITVLDLLRIAAGKQLTVSASCEFLSEVGFSMPAINLAMVDLPPPLGPVTTTNLPSSIFKSRCRMISFSLLSSCTLKLTSFNSSMIPPDNNIKNNSNASVSVQFSHSVVSNSW